MYTGRMIVQKFGQLLPELLGHRLACTPPKYQYTNLVRTYLYEVTMVVFPSIWKLLAMATCRSQPFSTVSLIYREPLGFLKVPFRSAGGLEVPISTMIGGC